MRQWVARTPHAYPFSSLFVVPRIHPPTLWSSRLKNPGGRGGVTLLKKQTNANRGEGGGA